MEASSPPGPVADLREALIRAAREILQGSDTALDLRKVAERVGKSRTAPYLAFGKTESGGGLEALRLSVAAQGHHELARDVAQAVKDADMSRALPAAASAYIDFANRRPRLFLLMFDAEASKAVRGTSHDAVREDAGILVAARSSLERAFAEAVALGQHAGRVRAGEIYPLALNAWAAIHGAALLLLDGQLGAAGITSAPEAVDVALRGLITD